MLRFLKTSLLIGALLTGSTLTVTAQQAPAPKPDSPYKLVEVQPEFPGGQGELLRFIARSVIYPPKALRKGIEGKVYVRFIVDEDGKVIEPTVFAGIGHGCDAEAIRVVSMLPQFRPGTQNGKPVKVYFSLPINYAIKRGKHFLSEPDFAPDPGVVYDNPQQPAHYKPLAWNEGVELFNQPALAGKPEAVTVRLRLDTKGAVQQARFPSHETATGRLDSLALRVVAAHPDWRSARQGGVPVETNLSHTVTFGLANLPEVYYSPDVPNAYADGENALWRQIQAATHKPDAAKDTFGDVLVRVVIDEHGRVTAPEVASALHPACDAEALRVVQSLPPFVPAEHGGQRVKSYRVLRVGFL